MRSKDIHLSLSEAEKFYEEHKTRFFFQRLTQFMTSGPLSVHILTGDDVISRWRTLIGPTKVFKTQYDDPSSFRGSFGITDTRNSCHGSDSLETALKEVAFFFPEFCYKTFLSKEAIYFQDNKVLFCEDKCIHVPIKPDTIFG